MRCAGFAALFLILATSSLAAGQEYSVRAVDADSGKPLKDIPITLRYDCTYEGAGLQVKTRCKFIQRTTGADGMAHFPEAGSLHEIDDIFALPIKHVAICCDILNPEIPGTGTMKFKRRSLAEMMHWILLVIEEARRVGKPLAFATTIAILHARHPQ